MESMLCLLSPTPTKLSPFKKLTSASALKTTFSSLSFASMTSPPQQKTPSTKILSSSKTSKTLSPKTPTTSTSVQETSTPVSPPLKKVLVPIGFGTEEMEAVIIVDVLRRAGAEVIVASVEPQLEVEAAGGTRLVADTSISKCANEVFDLVALPGGMPGSARLRDCEVLRQITSKQAEGKRLYGAICAAPAITLLPWGLLRRKQMTGHPAFMDKLPTFWAVASKIQVSGELTTSRGPGTSFEFALSLVDQLFGESVAKEVGQLLLMQADDDTQRKEEYNKVEWSFDHNPRVLLPIANGSEEIEIVAIVDILRRAKVDVVVASIEKSVQILASRGIKIVADKLIGDAAESVYDLIILPGGNAGAERLHKSKVLKKLLQEQYTAGRIYGAVCSSPAVLHRQGLLKDKRATAHPSVVTDLNNVSNGAKVVIDGFKHTHTRRTLSGLILSIMAKSDVKLIGAWPSPFVMRPRIALNVKSVGYEFLEETPGSKSQLLLESNPVHKKIPVLIHDGKPICESLVIVEYIDEVWSSGPTILPSDPYDRALARFWAAYLDEKWFPTMRSIAGAKEEEARKALIEQAGKGVMMLEDAFSRCSKGKGFFGGDQIGYLDIAFGSFLGWLRATEKMNGVKLIDETKTPSLLKWATSFSSHPAVKDVLPETEKLVEFAKVLAKFKAASSNS